MLKKPLSIVAFVAMGFISFPAFADGHSTGDPVKGERGFKKCASCHEVGEGAKAKVGPPLTGVVGRKVASVEGYKYGKSIVALGETGAVWTEEELIAYLKNPKKYLRAKLENKKAKSKMAFRLKKEEARADVVAYLKTFTKPAE